MQVFIQSLEALSQWKTIICVTSGAVVNAVNAALDFVSDRIG